MSSPKGEFLSYMSETLSISQESLVHMQDSNPSNFQKLLEKAKRSMRREKAKQRTQKEEYEIVSTSRKIKRKREEEEQGDKKTIQMLRNRISAQNSRDRKKYYLQQLEEETQKEYQKNNELREQLQELQQKNNKLNQKSSKIQSQLNIVQQSSGCSRLGKLGLALLTLVSVFSVIGQKESQPSLQQSLIKIEDIQSDSGIPMEYEKSYSVVDTNTFFEEEKIEASEESNHCFRPWNSLYRLQSHEYEYLQQQI